MTAISTALQNFRFLSLIYVIVVIETSVMATVAMLVTKATLNCVRFITTNVSCLVVASAIMVDVKKSQLFCKKLSFIKN